MIEVGIFLLIVGMVSFWAGYASRGAVAEADQEQLSAAYSRGCGDCRCQKVFQ